MILTVLVGLHHFPSSPLTPYLDASVHPTTSVTSFESPEQIGCRPATGRPKAEARCRRGRAGPPWVLSSPVFGLSRTFDDRGRPLLDRTHVEIASCGDLE